MKKSKLLNIAKALQEAHFPEESIISWQANDAMIFRGQTLEEARSLARRIMVEIDRFMTNRQANAKWGRFVGFEIFYPAPRYNIYRVDKNGGLEPFLQIVPPPSYKPELPW